MIRRFFPLSTAAATAMPAHAGLELLATAVLLMRNDGRVSYANPAAENLFELSRPKIVGHTASYRMVPADTRSHLQTA